jgi:uncharacterized membrane protein
MMDLLSFLLVISLLGGGLLVGVHLSIASAVLDALGQPEPEQSMFVMREINDRLSGPLFILLFIVTLTAVCGVAVISYLVLESAERWWLIAGSILYVLGPFGVTMIHNSPLNQKLREADWSNAQRIWPGYYRPARFWSLVRALLGVAAFGALAVGAIAL